MAQNSFPSEREKSISALELQNNQNNTSVGQALPSDMRRQLVEKSMSIGSIYLRAGLGTEPPRSIYLGTEHAAEGNRPQPCPSVPQKTNSIERKIKTWSKRCSGSENQKILLFLFWGAGSIRREHGMLLFGNLCFKTYFPSQNEAVMWCDCSDQRALSCQ